MGFGTLFIGYFLLLNIAYYTFTDIISALVMAMGLYKLSSVNRGFGYAFYASIGFALIGAGELFLEIFRMFFRSSVSDDILSFLTIPRYTLIALCSVMILTGLREVAKEVKLKSLYRKCDILAVPTGVSYVILAILEIPASLENTLPLALASVILLMISFVLVIINLTAIYTAYMKICMPNDRDMPDKPSKFGFVNKFRERSEEKNREYAEYKLRRRIERAEKRRKK